MQSPLLVSPMLGPDQYGVVTRVTPESAGWEHLSMEMRRLKQGQEWQHETNDCEMAIVILGGVCTVTSDKGTWERIGRRPDVFSGMPYAVFLPRATKFTVSALSEKLEIAYSWVKTDQDRPARLVTPKDSSIEIRGGLNATRQINSIMPPGFDAHRIVCVEVYTPGGNWSSYPPHKHDVHTEDSEHKIEEADLEEIYFYKFQRPEGFAFQRVYTDDRSLDEAVVAQDNHVVLVPRGYHPVSTAYGYHCYYLNFLAGTAQSLAFSDDPAHAWTKQTWTEHDNRLPLVSHKMEEAVARVPQAEVV